MSEPGLVFVNENNKEKVVVEAREVEVKETIGVGENS